MQIINHIVLVNFSRTKQKHLCLTIYESSNGNIKIDVRLEDETVWLTQEQIALWFGKSRSIITKHIRNVFSEGELQEKVVCRNFRNTTSSCNSPSEKTFRICSVIVLRLFPNNSAICSCVNQTISSPKRTSILIFQFEDS
jgi:hypothetical protein